MLPRQRQKIDDLESEKEKYRQLSSAAALSNVLNRHGIERFVETLQVNRVPASVIISTSITDDSGH